MSGNRLADRYVIGNAHTRFAVTRTPQRASFPWRWPKGGWRIGWVIVWWSK